MQIYSELEAVLLCDDVAEKCTRAHALQAACVKTETLNRAVATPPLDCRYAGRPSKPILVPPSAVKNRKMTTQEGYAALLHAVCHIEFNAINLALDAAYRFRRLPESFTRDWIRVAAEEAKHFGLMRARVQSLGFDYGDFPAHNHLWDMAYKTAFDPLLRMALVPRVLEARGLDVTPPMRAKVAQRGDEATCAVLDVIYREEVGHVRVGNHWYQYLCAARNLDPMTVFRRLLQRYDLFIFRGHVNMDAREQAGFSAFELAMLADFEQQRSSQI
ncbi:ferritin-like domain-containing protein [Snodgrassella sp. CFCC 13594]|uniref:ferritin-like domain-containing protein n=1 Tax=Snodgrassella sp. CFCC 13594 TaxID=1775559 RepID=UPI0009EE7524|nr:ferritin-like domain-containing protein [Snodgrassella sp. CFCC 13594]